jgi:hypothetical protein
MVVSTSSGSMYAFKPASKSNSCIGLPSGSNSSLAAKRAIFRRALQLSPDAASTIYIF